MAYRNKTYVAFDGDSDIHYYRLMQAWHQNDNSTFSFYDAHELRQSRDSSQEETIKRSLKIRMNSSKLLILLIGEKTRYLYRFVRWEIEQAIDLNMPIIAVNLNGIRRMDSLRCPPILRERLALHVTFSPKIMQQALEIWEERSRQLQHAGKTGPYFFEDNVYEKLGL